jgi:hypothetical protein
MHDMNWVLHQSAPSLQAELDHEVFWICSRNCYIQRTGDACSCEVSNGRRMQLDKLDRSHEDSRFGPTLIQRSTGGETISNTG